MCAYMLFEVEATGEEALTDVTLVGVCLVSHVALAVPAQGAGMSKLLAAMLTGEELLSKMAAQMCL